MRFTEYQRSWELLLGGYEAAKKTIRRLEISACTLHVFYLFSQFLQTAKGNYLSYYWKGYF